MQCHYLSGIAIETSAPAVVSAIPAIAAAAAVGMGLAAQISLVAILHFATVVVLLRESVTQSPKDSMRLISINSTR